MAEQSTSSAIGHFSLRARFLLRKASYLWAPRAASWLRKQWVILRNPQATIRFEGPVYLGPGFSLYMPDGGTFVVGPGVEFRRGFRAEIAAGGEVRIGAGCHFTFDPLIRCATSVTFGDECMVGQASVISDGGNSSRLGGVPRPLKIANGAVITSKCTVLDNLGDRAWIGANTVVSEPIPAYSVAGGVPARVLDYFGPEPEAQPEVVSGVRS
ncbi:MAG: hypothetical protein M3383_02145 [Actinomycetota bacterium]|nr:hypothetical protein [Actinomycetota bacterium]